jgi:hypothetical protein
MKYDLILKYIVLLFLITGKLYAQKITRYYIFGTLWTYNLSEIRHTKVYNKKLTGKWRVVSSEILKTDQAGDTVEIITSKGDWNGLTDIQFHENRTVGYRGDSLFKVPSFQIYWAYTSDSVKVYTPEARSGKSPTEWEYRKLAPTGILLYKLTTPGIVTITSAIHIKKLTRKKLLLGDYGLTVTLEKVN